MDVKVSNRLKSHPVCLVSDQGVSFEMEKVFEPNFEDAILFEKRVEPLFAQILANTNEIQQLLDLQNALLTQLSSR